MTLPLENQVTSLELSKRLRELKIPQESLFYWQTDRTGTTGLSYGKTNDNFGLSVIEWSSAFTCSELGEMLEPFNKLWYTEFDDTEVNCRAKMLIYLLENGLVTLPTK